VNAGLSAIKTDCYQVDAFRHSDTQVSQTFKSMRRAAQWAAFVH